MVKKSATGRRAAGDPQKIIDSALALAGRMRWADVGLAEIAAEAELTLGATLAHYRSKTAILAAYMGQVDDQVVAGISADILDQAVRDRLFETLMRRFDALAPHRNAIRSILRSSGCDPLAAGCGALALLRSMGVMLECAGVGSHGFRGRIRAKGLAMIYLATLRVWLRDDSEDMAATMAALDRALDRADRLVGRLCRRARPRRAADDGGEGEGG
ncbi:MAG: hypothetical protein QF926_10095 [Alphaproteobacteria bacterium]|nr:hypothetical protein [Alphaproteobacteria bacterium]MDP6516956.1 hypothetical protein [Alphaproteobacteria bacterium]